MRFTKFKIYIEPDCKIIYSSYYIKGLYDVFGKKNVRFSSKYFADLIKEKNDYSRDAYMAFVIRQNKKTSRIIIDFGDNWLIREDAYNWCDIYAKINYNPDSTLDRHKDKVVSIPPGFGIKIWSVLEAIYHSFSNLIRLKFKPQISMKTHFLSYLSQIKQHRLNNFTAKKNAESVPNNYVFFIASLWPHATCLTGTNRYRKMFIDSCIKSGLNFEGGFWVTDTSHPQFAEFKQITFAKRYPLLEFIKKTRKSLFVFNTPAVHNCHGWKLGQFLAMNKAIISTPFQNVLPVDLEHGKNIHFVNDEKEIDSAIEKILSDEIYRQKLEEGAKNYYLKYASPEAVISQIFEKLK